MLRKRFKMGKHQNIFILETPTWEVKAKGTKVHNLFITVKIAWSFEYTIPALNDSLGHVVTLHIFVFLNTPFLT